MRRPSILSNEKRCFVCGLAYSLHCHHIVFGTANRRVSDREGLWVYLCAYHHQAQPEGVHFNKELDLELKQLAQEIWEEKHNDSNHEKFRKLFGKSYL